MIQNGTVLGGMYQIIREIGQGGTGVIYLAEHLRLQKKIVVKKIKDHFTGQVNGRAEVDILKRLHHTCLPQVYDFLVIDSCVYTVMEYVEGYDLQWYLDRGYQFSEQTIRQWLIQLSEVLEYLHSQKPPILHSDIKPANLMVTPQGTLCLIDFNISLDGENGKEIQGLSPWYAAPEQYEKAQNVLYGKPDKIVLDGRMDIYSLGATFYRVMTGILPSPEKIPAQDIAAMELPYSDGLKAVVSKAMKRKRSARFQSAKQMRKFLTEMERMDPLYRRYGNLQIAGIFTWICCVIVSAMFLYYGNWRNEVETWQSAYRELYLSAEAQNETEIVSKATEMLNGYQYKGYLKTHEEKRAEILHTLGESYFRQEEYKEAASCYSEAWELMPDAEGYCKDYVVALVRSGQLSKAKLAIDLAGEDQGMSQDEIRLIQAEIAWMREDADTALAILEGLDGSSDTDVLQSVYLLQASIYESRAEYGKAVTILDAVQQIRPSKEVLRELGQTAVKAAEAEQNRSYYLQKALECYQSLNQGGEPSYNDRLNLALVQRASGAYEDSNTILKKMQELYPDDYVIFMWMCYNDLALADQKEDNASILENLKSHYKDCKYYYNASGEESQDMEELIDIMQKIGIQGTKNG